MARGSLQGVGSRLQSSPAVTSQVQASGERSVAIGGDVSGSTIITGNDNVVGSGNVVQRGKYNINMNQASGLHIGDTYYSEEENDIRREQSVNELQKGDLSSKGINQEQDTSIEVPVYFRNRSRKIKQQVNQNNLWRKKKSIWTASIWISKSQHSNRASHGES